MQRVTYAQEAIDDLFTKRKTKAPARPYSVCRACNAFKQMSENTAVVLCDTCYADLDATRTELEQRQITLVSTQERVWNDWEAAQAALTPEQVTKWQALLTARKRGFNAIEQQRVESIIANDADPLHAIVVACNESEAALHYAADQLELIQRGLDELKKAASLR